METTATTSHAQQPGWEHRLQAVLALLGGEPVPQVTVRFGMGRSILYKWRHRALQALQHALTDHRPGPQCPHNRLSPEGEQPLVELAQRHPTWSAAQIHAKAGPEAPSPRTIQRLRHRCDLAALAQTAGAPSARQVPHACGKAGGPPPHRDEAVAGSGTPGLGTPERRAHANQPRDHQADEARHAAGPDAAPPPPLGVSTHVITRIVSGMATVWKKCLTR
jgi:transposase